MTDTVNHISVALDAATELAIALRGKAYKEAAGPCFSVDCDGETHVADCMRVRLVLKKWYEARYALLGPSQARN